MEHPPDEDDLIAYAKTGNVDGVRSCLDLGLDANTIDMDANHFLRSVLHYAANAGHLGVARILLEAGADVNIEDREDSSPLHLAAAKGHKAVVACLLDFEAEVDKEDCEKETPLHRASQ